MARPKPPPGPAYLRPAEVAELLQVDVKTINRWAKEGKLPHRMTLGGHRRYEERTIRALLAELTVPISDAEVRRLHP